MKPSIAAKLSQLVDRQDEVSRLLASEEATRNMDQFRKLTREIGRASCRERVYRFV